MMSTIDLTVLTDGGRVHNLAGKERGESAREALGLDHLDASHETVEVQVPSYLYNISSSFFLGLFSESLRKYPSKDAFLHKYHFDANQVIMAQVLHAIDRGLMHRGPLGPEHKGSFFKRR